MKITILGSGTSTGVPQVGCTCPVCTSRDPRDNRLRCSGLVEVDGVRILIDCGPDFREQMIRLNDFKPIDAVLVSHEHYDHVGGLDDLRPYCQFRDVPVCPSYSVGNRSGRCAVYSKQPGREYRRGGAVPGDARQAAHPGLPYRPDGVDNGYAHHAGVILRGVEGAGLSGDECFAYRTSLDASEPFRSLGAGRPYRRAADLVHSHEPSDGASCRGGRHASRRNPSGLRRPLRHSLIVAVFRFSGWY